MSGRRVCLAVLAGLGLAAAQPSAPLWTTAVNGAGNEWASACAVDNAGHLYVTGMMNDRTSDDIAVFRFDAVTGDTLGSLRYDNPQRTQDSQDWGLGVAVDAGSNAVFVSGSVDTGALQDYILIKTNLLLSDTIWTRRYNGLDNGMDMGARCAMDGAGVLYQTGTSADASGSGIVTIKYNASSGDTIWTRRYSGPAGGDDLGYGCAVDANHNVFVVGRSFNGTALDLVIIKYNAAGDTLWTRREPTGMGVSLWFWICDDCAVDSSGSVYAAGSRSRHPNPDSLSGDMMTVKYSAAGVRQWGHIYSDPAGSSAAWGCAFAPSGVFYVSGMGIWAPGTDSMGGAMTTVAYNAVTGDTLWSTRVHEGTGSSAAQGCAVDAAGDLYVSGFSWTSDAVRGDFYAVKYHTGGTAVTGGHAGLSGRGASLLTAAVDAGKAAFAFAPAARALRIYDGSGRLVRSFAPQALATGRAAWDGANQFGRQTPAGLYYGRLTTAEGGSAAVGFVRP